MWAKFRPLVLLRISRSCVRRLTMRSQSWRNSRRRGGGANWSTQSTVLQPGSSATSLCIVLHLYLAFQKSWPRQFSGRIRATTRFQTPSSSQSLGSWTRESHSMSEEWGDPFAHLLILTVVFDENVFRHEVLWRMLEQVPLSRLGLLSRVSAIATL